LIVDEVCTASHCSNKQAGTLYGSLNQQLGYYLFQNYEKEEKAVHKWLRMQESNSVIKEFLNYIGRGGKCINKHWDYVENNDNSV